MLCWISSIETIFSHLAKQRQTNAIVITFFTSTADEEGRVGGVLGACVPGGVHQLTLHHPACPSKPSSPPTAYSMHIPHSWPDGFLLGCHFLALAGELEVGASEELLLFSFGGGLAATVKDAWGPLGAAQVGGDSPFRAGPAAWSSRLSARPPYLPGGPPPLPFVFQLL